MGINSHLLFERTHAYTHIFAGCREKGAGVPKRLHAAARITQHFRVASEEAKAGHDQFCNPMISTFTMTAAAIAPFALLGAYKTSTPSWVPAGKVDL